MRPQWTTDVPDEVTGTSFPLIRTPVAQALTAIITTENLVGTYTHYYKGRTQPCLGKDCEACYHGTQYRWHAYVTALQPDKHLHFLYECTAPPAQVLVDYRNRYATLRGCKFRAFRLHRRPNSRIIIETAPADLDKLNLPKAPNILKILCNLWGIPFDPTVTLTRHPENDTPNIAPTTIKDLVDEAAAKLN